MKAILNNHSILGEESNSRKRKKIKHTNFAPSSEKQSYSFPEALSVIMNNKLTHIFL